MHRISLILLTGLLILCPSYKLGDRIEQKQFIVWNTGQGQWTTWVTENECLHFDVGGEFDLSKKVARLCGEKFNKIFLSHWDWDHIGLVGKFRVKTQHFCIAARPKGSASPHKERLLAGILSCLDSETRVASLFQQPMDDPRFLKKSEHSANHLSSVFWLKPASFLIPGDSTADEENFWKKEVPASTKGLVLGHHGSRSSTSLALLDKLPELQWAVSSARFSRYGHPHAEVVKRLAQKKIPLLRTEDWGTLHFYQR